MANINITLEAGLTNDYGVFNLNLNMIKDEKKNCLSVDIISDGDQFVESENSEFQHGGNTNYKDHEGIKPIDSNISNWTNYGSRLVEKLRKYLNNLTKDTYALGELWEDYKKYTNQFEVIFTGDYKDSSSEDYEYISYNNQLVNVKDTNKTVKTYSLYDGYKGIGIEAYIIHFSKYYNIYSLTSGSQKILRPLLYYSEDLDTYNIGIRTNTINNETTYEPYLRYLTCLNFWRSKKGGDRKEYLHVDLASYDEKTDIYDCTINNMTHIVNNHEENSEGHNWSQFRTNPDNRPTFEMKWEENWNKMPTGFFLLGFYEKNNGYWFDYTNTGSKDTKKYLPKVWTDTFSGIGEFNVTTHRTNNNEYGYMGNAGLIGGGIKVNLAFLGLMYRYDKNKNWHIFNSYFPTSSPSQPSKKLDLVTQNIYYNSSAKYPKTIGLIISSILTSIYVYKDESSQNIKYISDIVFLGDYSTTYTKDIVYKIYKSKNTVTDNDLLLFHKMSYTDYIKELQEYELKEDKTFNNNNVNAIIKSGVKNIPLQFKLNYLQPKLDNIGDIASVRVCTITGEEINCSNDIVKPNELYYLDDNNNINNINSNFTIKWLQSLEKKDDGILLGKLDPKLENTPNSYIKDMFNYNDGILGFNINEIISKKIPRYSIKTDEKYDNTFFDLLTNDILLPAARIF